MVGFHKTNRYKGTVLSLSDKEVVIELTYGKRVAMARKPWVKIGRLVYLLIGSDGHAKDYMEKHTAEIAALADPRSYTQTPSTPLTEVDTTGEYYGHTDNDLVGNEYMYGCNQDDPHLWD